jgi:hypothetical protein
LVDGQVSGDRINSFVVGQHTTFGSGRRRTSDTRNEYHRELSALAFDLQTEFVLALIWFEEPKRLVPTKSHHDLGVDGMLQRRVRCYSLQPHQRSSSFCCSRPFLDGQLLPRRSISNSSLIWPPERRGMKAKHRQGYHAERKAFTGRMCRPRFAGQARFDTAFRSVRKSVIDGARILLRRPYARRTGIAGRPRAAGAVSRRAVRAHENQS